jgi:hypothetical protein
MQFTRKVPVKEGDEGCDTGGKKVVNKFGIVLEALFIYGNPFDLPEGRHGT